jgi:hypothetical protein
MMQALHEHIAKDGFRLRGTAMSRIDGFSDVVFGFALTLLVVSLEVPRTYDELHTVLLGFVPFAICFAFLIMVWYAHFRFFRRYNLHDFRTILINSALLFTVLFYVYPLKFLFNLISFQVVGITTTVDSTHKIVPVFSAAWQTRELMVIYGLGFAATYFCLAALYWNAWRQRTHLRLNPLETTLTLTYMWDLVGAASVGLLCCATAMILPAERAGNAGWVFFTIGIYKTIHGFIAGKRVRAARVRTKPEDHGPLSHAS